MSPWSPRDLRGRARDLRWWTSSRLGASAISLRRLRSSRVEALLLIPDRLPERRGHSERHAAGRVRGEQGGSGGGCAHRLVSFAGHADVPARQRVRRVGCAEFRVLHQTRSAIFHRALLRPPAFVGACRVVPSPAASAGLGLGAAGRRRLGDDGRLRRLALAGGGHGSGIAAGSGGDSIFSVGLTPACAPGPLLGSVDQGLDLGLLLRRSCRRPPERPPSRISMPASSS